MSARELWYIFQTCTLPFQSKLIKRQLNDEKHRWALKQNSLMNDNELSLILAPRYRIEGVEFDIMLDIWLNLNLKLNLILTWTYLKDNILI